MVTVACRDGDGFGVLDVVDGGVDGVVVVRGRHVVGEREMWEEGRGEGGGRRGVYELEERVAKPQTPP